jgi:hypothetical protein
MEAGFVGALRERVRTQSLTMLALLVAGLAFGIALLVGWATAGTREDLRRVQQLPAAKPVPRLVLLGAATALPAPPPRRSSSKAAAPDVPRLIVGSG